jgi:hypothetical protein
MFLNINLLYLQLAINAHTHACRQIWLCYVINMFIYIIPIILVEDPYYKFILTHNKIAQILLKHKENLICSLFELNI